MTVKAHRTGLSAMKKAAQDILHLRPGGRVEYGTRFVGEEESPNSLAWGEDSDLYDTYPVSDLTRAEVSKGAVVLDLYVYGSRTGGLAGNVDAFWLDGQFLGCADPFTQPERHAELSRSLAQGSSSAASG